MVHSPKISIIAAVAENLAIGDSNKLLWDIPEDLKRFKNLTTGHPIIMGRKTFESIGRSLPNRTNIIVSRDKDFNVNGCLVCHSLDEALKEAKQIEQNEVFIIGGGQIYHQAIDFVDKLYLTLVENKYNADTYFPDYRQFTKLVFKQLGQSGNLKYKFIELERE